MAPRYKDKEVRLRCSRLFSTICGLVSGPMGGGICSGRCGAYNVPGGGLNDSAMASGFVAMVWVGEDAVGKGCS